MVHKHQPEPFNEPEAYKLEPTMTHGAMWKEVSAIMMGNVGETVKDGVQNLLSRSHAVACASYGMTRGFNPADSAYDDI